MKKLIFYFLLFVALPTKAQVGIGTDFPHSSAQLEVMSTNKGLLPPRMTLVQRDAIVSPVAGLMIYCSDCGSSGELEVYNGTAWTNVVGGATLANPPVITTTAITSITKTSASSGGNITSEGGNIVTNRGVCWSLTSSPTIASSKTSNGTGIGSFGSTLTGLTAGTTYYVRAYATNSAGTGYGNEITFSTLASDIVFNPSLTYGSVTDIDGNVYKTIQIGNQVWMAENLKTTHYQNGERIQNISDNSTWSALTTGAYCWFNNDSNLYKETYGALYNFYAIADSRKIEPSGWHVPSDAEWTILTTYLGGLSESGGKLKELGTSHWYAPNNNATNNTGFTALPGGLRRNIDPFFQYLQEYTVFWSTTIYPGDISCARGRSMNKDDGQASAGYYYKFTGQSVRCVKD